MSDGEFWKVRDQRWYDDRVSGILVRPLKPGEAGFNQLSTRRERTHARVQGLLRDLRPGWQHADARAWSTRRRTVPGHHRPIRSPQARRSDHEVERPKHAIEAAGERVENFFFPVLGPGWLGAFADDEYYKTEEEYVYAMAVIAKADFKAVIDAGFTLQIDDPALVARWGSGRAADESRGRTARIARRASRPRTGRSRAFRRSACCYHTCWGSWHTPHVTDMPFEAHVDIMLQVKSAPASVEAADVRHELTTRSGRDQAAGRQGLHPRRHRPQDVDGGAAGAGGAPPRAVRQHHGQREHRRRRRLRRRRALLPGHRLGQAQGAGRGRAAGESPTLGLDFPGKPAGSFASGWGACAL